MVRSKAYRRIVDPKDAIMVSLVRSTNPKCEHGGRGISQIDNDLDIQVFDFDQLLGSWNPVGEEHIMDVDKVQVSTILDSAMKFNVALNLAPEGATLCGKKCCIQCALQSHNLRSRGYHFVSRMNVSGQHLMQTSNKIF